MPDRSLEKNKAEAATTANEPAADKSHAAGADNAVTVAKLQEAEAKVKQLEAHAASKDAAAAAATDEADKAKLTAEAAEARRIAAELKAQITPAGDKPKGKGGAIAGLIIGGVIAAVSIVSLIARG